MISKRLLFSAFVLILWSILGSLADAAAAHPAIPAQPSKPECNPAALRLAQGMGVDCSVLMDYQARGVGLGVIRQAYALSQSFDGPSWQALVDMHVSGEGPGWGEMKKAYRLANQLGVDPQALLEQRAQGLGWGEILQEHREGPGKPPWAGGPKLEKVGPGRPPWAGAGPPPWARPGRAKTAARRGAQN
jgi:hypothetical protein